MRISGRAACVGGYVCTCLSLPPWATRKEVAVKSLEKTGCPSKAHEADCLLSICYLQNWEAVLHSVDHTLKWEMSKTGMCSEVRDKDGGRTSWNVYENVQQLKEMWVLRLGPGWASCTWQLSSNQVKTHTWDGGWSHSIKPWNTKSDAKEMEEICVELHTQEVPEMRWALASILFIHSSSTCGWCASNHGTQQDKQAPHGENITDQVNSTERRNRSPKFYLGKRPPKLITTFPSFPCS